MSDSDRPRVKICGITNEDDALASIRLGASALGFNGWKGSRRYLDLSIARSWIETLPLFVTRVAVLVNPSREEADHVASLTAIDMLQFHGDETPEFCAQFLDQGVQCIKAFRLPLDSNRPDPSSYPAMPFLVDASVPGEFGGTGHLIDSSLARDFVAAHPERCVLLSGGLNPGNVAEMIKQVRPYAVDLASGVESGPGKKDHAKLRALFEAVRRD